MFDCYFFSPSKEVPVSCPLEIKVRGYFEYLTLDRHYRLP